MRKRVISVFLSIAVAFSLCAGFSQHAGAVFFTSVNDSLMDLNDSTMPVSYGGVMYVPYTVFISSSLRIYSSTLSTGDLALFTSSRQIYFDVSNGGCRDKNGNEYDDSAIIRNGSAYVPALFTADYFGLQYSYIETSYGGMVRIRSSSSVLSDSVFTDAALSAMRSKLNEYNRNHGASGTAEPQVSGSPRPSVTASPSPTPVTYERVRLALIFTGLSDSTEAMLNSLTANGFNACFFVTGEDVAAYPELVREIDGRGHTVGVLCENGAEFEETARLLYETAKIKADIAAVWGDDPGGINAVVWELQPESALLRTTGEISTEPYSRDRLVFTSDPEAAQRLPEILRYIREYKYTVTKINELTEPY